MSLNDIVRFLVKKDFDKDSFLNAPVHQAIQEELTILVSPHTTVHTLLSKFVKYHPYRVAVAEDQGITNIVSQIDVVRWFAAHSAELFPDQVKKRLFEIPELGSVNKFSVNEKTPIREVANVLASKKVNGLAVINDAGIMKSSVSAQTFRSLSAEHWPDFSQPISSLKTEGRDQFWVPLQRTLEELLHTVLDNNFHRVWVLGDDDKPKKIVTLTDLLVYFNGLVTGYKAERKPVTGSLVWPLI